MRRLAVVRSIFDADGALAGKQYARRQRVRHDRQIGSPPRLLQITDRRRPAPAVVGRELKIAGAFLARPVENVVALKSGLLDRRDEGFAQRMRLAHIGDLEMPADAVQLVGPALLIL